MKMKLFILALASLLFSTACNNESVKPSEKTGSIPINDSPVLIAPPKEKTIAFDNLKMGTPFETWINSADAVGLPNIVTDSQSIALKFRSYEEFITVVEAVKPKAGHTYNFSIGVKAVANTEPQIRLWISRDCAVVEDLNIESFMVSSMKPRYEISHTFSQDFPCMKVGLNVLNASPETPQQIVISSPIVKRVD